MSERRPVRVALNAGRARSPLSRNDGFTATSAPNRNVEQPQEQGSFAGSFTGSVTQGRITPGAAGQGSEVDIKIVCVGAANTGKTTFLKYWETGEAALHVPTTIQMEFHRKETVITLPPSGYESPLPANSSFSPFLSSFFAGSGPIPQEIASTSQTTACRTSEPQKADESGRSAHAGNASQLLSLDRPSNSSAFSASRKLEVPLKSSSTAANLPTRSETAAVGAPRPAQPSGPREVVFSSYDECEPTPVVVAVAASSNSLSDAPAKEKQVDSVRSSKTMPETSEISETPVMEEEPARFHSTFAELRSAMVDAEAGSAVSPAMFAASERRRSAERSVNKELNVRKHAQYSFCIPVLPSYWYEADSAAAEVALGISPNQASFASSTVRRNRSGVFGASSSPTVRIANGTGDQMGAQSTSQTKRSPILNLRFLNAPSKNSNDRNYSMLGGPDDHSEQGFEDYVLRGEKRPAIVKVWDIQGQEGTKSMTRIFYTGAIGALIFCELSNSMESITSALSWKNDVARKVFVQRRFGAKAAQKSTPALKPSGRIRRGRAKEEPEEQEDETPPCWLVINKYDVIRDLPEPLPKWATHDALNQLCKQHGFAGWSYCAGRRGLNVEETIEALLAAIAERFPDELRYQQAGANGAGGAGGERGRDGQSGGISAGTAPLGGSSVIRRTRIRPPKNESRCCN